MIGEHDRARGHRQHQRTVLRLLDFVRRHADVAAAEIHHTVDDLLDAGAAAHRLVIDLQFRHLTLGRSASFSFGGTGKAPLAFLNDFEHNRRSNTTECDVFWKTDGNNTGRWVHLAWVYEGGRRSTLKLYLDGKPNNEQGYFTLATVPGYRMRLGGWFNTAEGEKNMFKGGVGSVRVYDYARTAAEIARSAAAALGR